MYTYFNTSNFGENYIRNYANGIELLLRKTNSLLKPIPKHFGILTQKFTYNVLTDAQ